jgi:hypothetical protein
MDRRVVSYDGQLWFWVDQLTSSLDIDPFEYIDQGELIKLDYDNKS